MMGLWGFFLIAGALGWGLWNLGIALLDREASQEAPRSDPDGS